MSIIVEDGTRTAAGANSYASVATVDQHFAARGNTDWTGTSQAKEAAILRAMDWLEAQPFIGLPLLGPVGAVNRQPLQWPRVDAVSQGYEFLSNEVPAGVVRALCEGALIELLTPGALAPELDRGGMVQSEKVDVIETTYAPGAPAGTVYSVLRAALRGLVRSGDTVALVRV